VLAREGVEAQLLANRLDPRLDGWRVLWRDETVCPVCGEACKRSTLPAGEVVYVGDGYSDRCAALAAGRVFATDGLARHLDEQGVPYERFADLRDVAARLS
jgi:2-hydroxy-3-keto-5-methylthiopentenyl-1-phosphate phosphatase